MTRSINSASQLGQTSITRPSNGCISKCQAKDPTMAKHGISLSLHSPVDDFKTFIGGLSWSKNPRSQLPSIATSTRSVAFQGSWTVSSPDASISKATSAHTLTFRSSPGKEAFSGSSSMTKRKTSRICRHGLTDCRSGLLSRLR